MTNASAITGTSTSAWIAGTGPLTSYFSAEFLLSRKAIPLYILLGITLLQRLPSFLERLFTPTPTANTSSFVVPAVTRHARFLPAESQHKFRYNTLYLALRLDKLETRKLDTVHAFSWKGPALVPEFVDEEELAGRKGVTPATVGAAEGAKDDWKAKMRAAERIERRRLEEKRARNDRYTWSLTGLHPSGYLRTHFPSSTESKEISMTSDKAKWISGSILLKLAYELRERNFLTVGPQDADLTGKDWRSELGQVWTVTMPSIIGITGINPLTVHYCYRPHNYPEPRSVKKGGEEERRGDFWLVVLEVHNTFSERHIYVLEAGKNEDSESGKRGAYGHQWTFPRSFHVSPFNDRGGFYRLFLREPFTAQKENFDLGIRLLLLVEDPASSPSSDAKAEPRLVKKLMATLDSMPATATSKGPQTGRCVRPLSPATLYAALLRQPLDLFLTFVRILWEAGKLHFKKRLDAFGRPEMVQPFEPSSSSSYDGVGLPPPVNKIQPHRDPSSNSNDGSVGLVYPEAGWGEVVAKDWVKKLISRRMKELHLERGEAWEVRVESTDPADEGLHISSGAKGEQRKLILYTRSYGVYTDLMAYQPPQLALLLGSITGRRWGVSSRADFDAFFGNNPPLDSIKGVRKRQFDFLLDSQDRQMANEMLQRLDIATVSQKDEGKGDREREGEGDEGWKVNTALWLGYVAAVAEKKVFGWLGARYVKGTEPWLELHRALAYLEAREGEKDEMTTKGGASWDTKLGSLYHP